MSAVDEAFDRLERLYGELAAMEELAQRLEVSRTAAEVARAADTVATCEAMLSGAEERERAAREALEGAEADGASAVRIDQLRREATYAGSLKGYRIGPVRHARRTLEALLVAGPFATAEEARAAQIDAGEAAEIEERLSIYREAYAAALTECQEAADAA